MKTMTVLQLEGKVVKCNDHWHARVDLHGREPVLSGACVTEEDAKEVLQFAREVAITLVTAGGGTTHVDTGKVQ